MVVNGYETKTTFWDDFSIADQFGIEAVQDTYKRAFKEWKTNYIYLTELCLVVNWKCWQHYDLGNTELSKVYSDMYYEVREYALDHLKGAEFEYYFNVTD